MLSSQVPKIFVYLVVLTKCTHEEHIDIWEE